MGKSECGLRGVFVMTTSTGLAETTLVGCCLLNLTEEEISFMLWVKSRPAKSVRPEHSIITLIME